MCLRTREKNEQHPLVQLKEAWKQMHYPPETATIMLLARMIAMVNQANDKSEILCNFYQFCRKTVDETKEISHNLMGEKFADQIDLLAEMLRGTLNVELVPEVLYNVKFTYLIVNRF